MKTQQYFAGVLLIAILVAGAILTVGDRLSRLMNPNPEIAAETGQLSSQGDFQIELPMVGDAVLEWSSPGTLFDDLTAPTPEELADAPDLGTLDLAFLLRRSGDTHVDGFVDLETTFVFTGYHTIDVMIDGANTTLVVGPQADGTYVDGVLNLISQRFTFLLDSGEEIERQFRLIGTPSATPGLLTGEYRETVWGYGVEPSTIVGTFEIKDLMITLASANEAPIVAPVALVTTRNTAVAAPLTAADPEGLPITYAIVDQPDNGTLSGSAPDLTYTPNNGFVGPDTFTFKVNDGELDSENGIVTIGVNLGPNSAPTATAQTVNAVRGQGKAITLAGADVDGDNLTFTVVSQPLNGTLSGTAPNLTYTSNGSFTGGDSFTFKVNDGTVDSANATVTINVAAPANNAPTANAQSVNAVQGQGKAITLTGSDSDGNALTFTVVDQPASGSLSGTAPNLTYTSNANFVGPDSFTFKVNDGTVDSATATVTINVTAEPVENTPPVANARSVNAVQGQAKSFTLTGSDADDDTLTFTVVSQPTNGTLSGSAPNLTYTSNGSFTGGDSFTFKVNDGTVDSATATVTINVTAEPVENSAPVANALSVNAVQGEAKTITLTGSDVDGDTLTFTVVAQPSNGTLSGTAPNLSYTSNGSFTGADSFTFKVNDGTIDSSTVTVSINVTAEPVENTPPVANARSVNAVQAQAKTITLTGSDADGDTLTFTVVSQPLNGTLSGSAPNLTYTPNAAFIGTDSFTFKVNDGSADSSTVTVNINVTAAPVENTAPVANAQSVNAVQGQAKTITLTGSDDDGDTLSFTIVAQPANGTLSGTAPDLTYTSNAAFVGTDSFTFKVNDGAADSETVTVSINVQAKPVDPQNNAPDANAGAITTVLGEAIAITLQASDADGDTVTFIIVTEPANGTLSGVVPNLVYTPNSDFVGTDSFTFKVNDGEMDSETVTVTITVSGEPTQEGNEVFLPTMRK